MAKSNPVVTPTVIKRNLQILPQNDAMFSCFLPDDQSDLIIDSDPAVLIKLKSYVACGEIGWLRLKYNTPSSAAEITSLCLAEDSEETQSLQKICLYVTRLWWAAYTDYPSYHKNEKVRTQELLILLSLLFWARLPVPIGQRNPALSAFFQFMLQLMCLYVYAHTHTRICIPLDSAYELRLLLWVLTSMQGAAAGFWIT